MLYREQTLVNEMMPTILIKSDAKKIILLFHTRLYKQVRTLARKKHPKLLIKKYFKYSYDNNSLQHKVSYLYLFATPVLEFIIKVEFLSFLI